MSKNSWRNAKTKYANWKQNVKFIDFENKISKKTCVLCFKK